MKKDLKLEIKTGGLGKEYLALAGMILVLIVLIAAGGYSWYYFKLSLTRELEAIDQEKQITVKQEINRDDLTQIKDYFNERQERYRAGQEMELREIF